MKILIIFIIFTICYQQAFAVQQGHPSSSENEMIANVFNGDLDAMYASSKYNEQAKSGNEPLFHERANNNEAGHKGWYYAEKALETASLALDYLMPRVITRDATVEIGGINPARFREVDKKGHQTTR